MTMSKRVLSSVLALAMVLSMFTGLSAIFAVPAKAAAGTSQVKSYADCLNDWGAGFIYYAVDMYEQDGNDWILTDHYINAGDTLKARIYIKSSRYMGSSTAGLVWSSNMFEHDVPAGSSSGGGTPVNCTVNPNHPAGATVANGGWGAAATRTWRLGSVLTNGVVRSTNNYLTPAMDPMLDEEITADWCNNTINATQFLLTNDATNRNQVWPVTSDEWYFEFTVTVKSGLTDGTTGFVMSPQAFWKTASKPSPWDFKWSDSASTAAGGGTSLTAGSAASVALMHMDDTKHVFTIGANPADQPSEPVAGTSQVKSYADCLNDWGAGFIYYAVDMYEQDGNDWILTDHYINAGDTLKARIYIKSSRYMGSSTAGLVWSSNMFEHDVPAGSSSGGGTPVNCTVNPNHPAGATVANGGWGAAATRTWRLGSVLTNGVVRSTNNYLTPAMDPMLDEEITADWCNNTINATQFLLTNDATNRNQVWPVTSDEWYFEFTVTVKSGLTDGTTGFVMSPQAFWKTASKPSPWDFKWSDSASTAAGGGTSLPAGNASSVAYMHMDDTKHVFTIGNPPVGGSKTITYMVGNDTYATYTLAVGADLTVPADPTPAAGYTFAGWALSTAPTVVVDLTGATVSDDVTYVAVFNQIVTHNAYFYVDGTLTATVETAEGAAINAPADPTKTGYTFAGWNPAVGNMGNADMTFNATFNPKSYTVTWMSEGTQVAQNSVNYDGAYTLPTAPTKLGYVFEGWYDQSLTTAIPATHTVDSAVTYYAKFTIGSFDAIFDANGGKFADDSTSQTVSTVFGNTPAAPANPTRTGYTFAGWQPEVGPMNTEGVTYVAQWDANTITITFMDGENQLGTVSGDYGTSANAIANPTKQGYTFNGWKDANDAAVIFPVQLSEDMTVYADWTAGTVQINFYKGTAGPSDWHAGGAQTVGAAMQLPADPVKSGSTFNGWKDINGNPIPATVPDVSTDYYAVWVDAGYTVSFYVRENATTGDWVLYDSDVLSQGASIEAPETPVIPGYTFQKWTKQGQSAAQTFPQPMPAGDISFYATFQVAKFWVYWVVDGNTVYSRQYNYGATFTDYNYTPPTGKTFSGWEEHQNTMPAYDYYIHGTTADITYTVTYTINGEVYDTETVAYNGTNTPPAYTAPEGYTFSGWATQTITGDVTIPATLTKNSYTVNYYLYATDTTPIATYTIPYGDPVTQPADPDVPGKEFIGWSANPETMPAQNLDIYAVFSDESYTVTINDENGTLITTIDNLVYGNIINDTDMPAQSKEGYNFNGWKIGNDFVSFPYTVTGSVTMQADFSINTYTITYKITGEEDHVETYEYQAAVTPYAAPAKEGYTFSGWSEAAPATMPAEDLVITGSYNVNQYDALFYDWDGQLLATVPTNYGEVPAAPADPDNRVGWEFARWDPALAPMTTAGATYTAIYEAGRVDVNVEVYVMDLDGDYILEGEVTPTPRAVADQPYTYVPAEREGFTVDTAQSDLYTPNVDADGSTILSVYYERNTYNFTTVVDGAENTTPYYYGANVAAPETPSKEGYRFDGWDVTIPTTMPANDVTATAQFTILQFTITFTNTGDSTIAPITQNFGTNVTAPADPVKEGYQFTGWSEAIPTTMPAENKTISATWQILQFTIHFEDTGDTVIADITQDYGTQIPAVADPEKEGYTFTGWSESIPTTMPAENKTITASWQVNQYDATFIIDGTPTVVPTNYGEIPVAPTAEKEGYSFTGWEPALAEMGIEGATYTAQFEVNSYNAYFDANEGIFTDDNTALKTVSTEYGQAINVPADPERTGYNFAGWDQEIPASMPANELTFVAQWSQDLSFVRVQSVERTTENYYESGLALYEIKVMGHPVKLQFVYAEATAYTWTCDRHDPLVSAADLSSVPGLVSIVAYDANDQVVATGSADTAYEIWTVNAQLVQGDYKVRAKIDTKVDSWENIETAFDYTVTYDERPVEDPTEYVISVTPAALAVKRGNTVAIEIVTDESVTKLLLERDNGDGTTSSTAFSSASSLASIADNGNGTKTWTITYRFTYTGTEDYQDQPWTVYYRTATSTAWAESGLGFTMHVSRYEIVETTEPTAYDPFTVVSVTPPENAVKAKYAPVTIVVTDDVAKVRLVNNATGKSSTYLVSTDQNACSNNVTVVSDADGLLTLSINYRFPTDGEQTWHVECRGNAWSSATEASTFTLTVAAR